VRIKCTRMQLLGRVGVLNLIFYPQKIAPNYSHLHCTSTVNSLLINN